MFSSIIIGIILGIILTVLIKQEQNKELIYLGQNTEVSSITGIILADSSLYNEQQIARFKIRKSHSKHITTSAQGITKIVIPPYQSEFLNGMMTQVFFQKQKILPSTQFLHVKSIQPTQEFSSIIWRWRAKILTKLRPFLIKRLKHSSDLVFSLILGDRSFLTPLQSENIKKSGLSHLFALSGLHINIIVWTLLGLSSFIKKHIRECFIYILLLCYLLLIGKSYPLMRAYMLITIGFFLKKICHNARSLDVLGFVCLLSLFFDPLALFLSSWQLSFLGTFGIIAFKEFYDSKIFYLPQFLRSALSTSLAVMTAITPCLIKHFGKTYPQGIIATIIILPMLVIWLPLNILTLCIPKALFILESYNQVIWKIITFFSFIPSLKTSHSLILWNICIPVIFIFIHMKVHKNIKTLYIK